MVLSFLVDVVMKGFGFFDKMQTGVLHLRIRFLNDIKLRVSNIIKLCSFLVYVVLKGFGSLSKCGGMGFLVIKGSRFPVSCDGMGF